MNKSNHSTRQTFAHNRAQALRRVKALSLNPDKDKGTLKSLITIKEIVYLKNTYNL